MKLLLTSAGLTNASLINALVEMTGKPIAQCRAVFIPTAMHAMPWGGRFLFDEFRKQNELGWKSLTILELTALPSLLEEHWLPAVRHSEVLVLAGGNAPFLSYWFEKSGFAKKLPELLQRTVYVGISASSMVMSQGLIINQEKLRETGIYAEDQYGDVAPPQAGSDYTLKLTDFILRPHLNSAYYERVTMRDMEEMAGMVAAPLYAIDDDTAIKVVDGHVEIVSEGEWKLFK